MPADRPAPRETALDAIAARERQHDLLLQRVAHRFWIERRTQQEIGEEYAFSRVTISRLLEEARTRGVVRFDIGEPVDRSPDLERELSTSLRRASPAAGAALSSCRVVTARSGGDDVHRWRLGRHAASTVRGLLPAGGTLAIASSRTTAPLASSADCLPSIRSVIELLGTSERGAGMTAGGEIARYLGVRHEMIPAPFIHRSDERAMTTHARSRVRSVLARAVRADLAFFGAGSLERFDGTGAHAPVSVDVLDDAARGGAVGHSLGIFFSADGREVPSALDGVRVGVAPAALLAVPRRVLFVWGGEKAAIARAVTAFGLVTDLVTDDVTARAMLACPDLSS